MNGSRIVDKRENKVSTVSIPLNWEKKIWVLGIFSRGDQNPKSWDEGSNCKVKVIREEGIIGFR